jgi:hypothetical protein
LPMFSVQGSEEIFGGHSKGAPPKD